MISVFSGGGISTGITKYVAEYKSRPKRLIGFIGSAFAFGFCFSAVFFLGTLIFSREIARMLFGDYGYSWLIVTIGIIQLVIFLGSAVISVANGLSRQDVFAKITITGYVFAIPLAFLLIYTNGISGAALALLVVASASGVPALYFVLRSPMLKLVRVKLSGSDSSRLLKFSFMALVSAVVFPFAEITIRTLIIKFLGHVDAGLWQAMTRLSGAYLGLFTLYLSTTYMPLLSSLNNRALVTKVVFGHLIKVGAIFIGFSLLVYSFKGFLVVTLYSDEFTAITEIMLWYLIGDFFRIGSYVIGFLGVAKAALRFYVFCELLQAVLLIFFSCLALYGGEKLIYVAQAYMYSYVVYFIVMLFLFNKFQRGSYDFSR